MLVFLFDETIVYAIFCILCFDAYLSSYHEKAIKAL